jgi:hypothetical protein
MSLSNLVRPALRPPVFGLPLLHIVLPIAIAVYADICGHVRLR